MFFATLYDLGSAKCYISWTKMTQCTRSIVFQATKNALCSKL